MQRRKDGLRLSKITEIKNQIHVLEKKIDEEINKKFTSAGNRIRKLRKNKQMTQEELSDCLDIGRTQLTNIERGNSRITIETLILVCDVFETTPNYILGYDRGR